MFNQQPSRQLSEGLDYKDMVGMIKPRIHIDEFSSKMGDDDDIIVVSFFLRSKQAAKDLTSWFEKGYDWILDADTSPGEIKPGRFLVYIEIRRRSSAGRNLALAIEDLASLTEFEPDKWVRIAKFMQLSAEDAIQPHHYLQQRTLAREEVVACQAEN